MNNLNLVMKSRTTPTRPTLELIVRLRTCNPGRQAEPFGGGMQASATVGAGVKDAAAASSGLQSSTNSLARHPAPALPPSESTNTRLIPLKVVFDKEAHIIDAAILRKDRSVLVKEAQHV